MKKFLLSLSIISLFLFANNSIAQIGFSNKIDSLINLITIQSISKLERQLSGDTACTIGGSPYTIVSRHYQNASNSKAAQYIYERFQEYGYTPRYQVNSSTSTNVLAVKTGTKYPNQYFVIGGHYDNMPSGSTAPGADDNATGTVAVLEAARILKNFPTEYSIIFIAYDEEERGLYGSKAFVDSSYYKGDSIVCNLNFDMIGYDSDNNNKSYIITNNASMEFADDYISAMRVYAPNMVPLKVVDLTANSDHASYWTRGYKAFMNIEDENDFTPYYHTVNDRFNTLNLPYFLNLVRTAVSSLTAFSNNMKMIFIHNKLNSGNYTTPRNLSIVIKSKTNIATGSNAPKLYYRTNNGTFNSLNYTSTNLDTFKYTIPAFPLSTVVDYYFAAQDANNNFVCTYPAGGRGMNPPGSIPPSTLLSYTIESVNTACIGNGSTTAEYPFYSYYDDARTDMLYLSSELGITTPSFISRIGFDFTQVSPQVLNEFTIKMQVTPNNTLTGFANSGWTTVYSQSYTPPATGMQYVYLTTPFAYNGSGNLLVEICFNNTTYTTNSIIKASAAPNMTWHQHQDLQTTSGCVALTDGSTQSNRPDLCFVYETVNGFENQSGNLPTKFELSQNFPNPFNPVTKINFALPKPGNVSLKIYDNLGKLVKTLVSEYKNAGYYTVDFNAYELSSGIYFYKIESGLYNDVKKMILIK